MDSLTSEGHIHIVKPLQTSRSSLQIRHPDHPDSSISPEARRAGAWDTADTAARQAISPALFGCLKVEQKNSHTRTALLQATDVNATVFDPRRINALLPPHSRHPHALTPKKNLATSLVSPSPQIKSSISYQAPAMLPTCISISNVIFLFFFFSLLPLTHAYICAKAHTPTPLPSDCYELIDFIELASRTAPWDTPKVWSRSAEDSAVSFKLPKTYYLRRPAAQGHSTCAIRVDAVPWNVRGHDTFALSAVGNVAGVVVEQCLVRRGEVGFEFPGRTERVEVGVIRADGRWWRGRVDAMRRVMGQDGMTLFEASGGRSALRNGTGVDIGVER